MGFDYDDRDAEAETIDFAMARPPQGRVMAEYAYDLSHAADEGKGFIYFPILNYGPMAAPRFRQPAAGVGRQRSISLVRRRRASAARHLRRRQRRPICCNHWVAHDRRGCAARIYPRANADHGASATKPREAVWPQ